MDFINVVKNRVSCRSYDAGRPVDIEVLKQIAEAGRLAPSANNMQPWTFLIVSSSEMLNKVRDCYRGRWLDSAPHILIVKGRRDLAWVRRDGYNSLETDLTIAMDHMILAAENYGVGTCWIAAFDNKQLRSVLNLQDSEVVYALTPLGYAVGAVGKKEKNRRPLDEVFRII